MTYREQRICIEALSQPRKVRVELAHVLLESLYKDVRPKKPTKLTGKTKRRLRG